MRGVLRARRRAQQLLAEHQVTKVPVNVYAIAKRYANVLKRPLDSEVSGVLIPIEKEKWVIVVNAMHPPLRRRFTVAHELGHLLLHNYRSPHADLTFRFRDARSSEGSALEEIQANQFAAELLIPRAELMREVAARHFDHAPTNDAEDVEFQEWIGTLARRFQVSRQAMMIRFSSIFA
jgi:Zn-dependent peptidase ImmA (M78 family)